MYEKSHKSINLYDHRQFPLLAACVAHIAKFGYTILSGRSSSFKARTAMYQYMRGGLGMAHPDIEESSEVSTAQQLERSQGIGTSKKVSFCT
jgi:hypothetical protein